MDANALIKQVDTQKRTLATVTKLIKELSTPVPDSDLASLTERGHKVTQLGKAIDRFAETADLLQQLATLAKQRKQEIAALLERARQRFGAQLDPALRPLGLTLSGQAPELKAGIFTIELDVNKGCARIWYGPKQEFLGDSPLSPDAIAKHLAKAQASLGARIEPSAFLDKLHEACRRVSCKNPRDPGRIIAVLGELAPLLQSTKFRSDPRAEHYVSYGRADFSYDLFRVSKLDQPTLFPQRFRLKVATRANTRQRQDFLWVPEDEKTGKGTTYSHIEFSEGNR